MCGGECGGIGREKAAGELGLNPATDYEMDQPNPLLWKEVWLRDGIRVSDNDDAQFLSGLYVSMCMCVRGCGRVG